MKNVEVKWGNDNVVNKRIEFSIVKINQGFFAKTNFREILGVANNRALPL